ncbi:hypothetical protein [Rhodococcus sp. SGAir0479]|uniref:hypothetical protein n=1 Tax=Rhodococcus sp. SGAir0479 TaxID=2567884 RepID=UPI0010CD4FB1|nr:hypothetical protein [Rhodococcus sp. SGAir0479]QCQ91443.1 hypothetical protein E7742_09450 [Rhodococcus sp. SGAir0479]
MSVVTDHPNPDPRPRADTGRPDAAAAATEWLRRSGSDVSIALGALSVITFWTFGLGIVLGLGAIGAGVVASRSEAVEDSEPRSLETLLGILSGGFGVLAGAVFLLVAAPHW